MWHSMKGGRGESLFASYYGSVSPHSVACGSGSCQNVALNGAPDIFPQTVSRPARTGDGQYPGLAANRRPPAQRPAGTANPTPKLHDAVPPWRWWRSPARRYDELMMLFNRTMEQAFIVPLRPSQKFCTVTFAAPPLIAKQLVHISLRKLASTKIKLGHQ